MDPAPHPAPYPTPLHPQGTCLSLTTPLVSSLLSSQALSACSSSLARLLAARLMTLQQPDANQHSSTGRGTGSELLLALGQRGNRECRAGHKLTFLNREASGGNGT